MPGFKLYKKKETVLEVSQNTSFSTKRWQSNQSRYSVQTVSERTYGKKKTEFNLNEGLLTFIDEHLHLGFSKKLLIQVLGKDLLLRNGNHRSVCLCVIVVPKGKREKAIFDSLLCLRTE